MFSSARSSADVSEEEAEPAPVVVAADPVDTASPEDDEDERRRLDVQKRMKRRSVRQFRWAVALHAVPTAYC